MSIERRDSRSNFDKYFQIHPPQFSQNSIADVKTAWSYAATPLYIVAE
jgi:hypothetical protein